jgi:hypothetical protein
LTYIARKWKLWQIIDLNIKFCKRERLSGGPGAGLTVRPDAQADAHSSLAVFRDLARLRRGLEI